MEKFTLYLASTSMSEKEARLLKIKNCLFSYFYKEGILRWVEYCERGVVKTSKKVMLDSGAFSAWSKGVEIDLDEYIEFARVMRERFRRLKVKFFIVNLDVIPGRKGETSSLNRSFNQRLIDAAAERGYKNMLKMIECGVVPIHVFHQGESFVWLDRMLEYTDYIGISPANDLPATQRRLWIDSVFNYLVKNGVKVKTHGFAVTSFSVMRDYPWTSCDSSTWKVFAAMGGIFYPVGGFREADYSKKPLAICVGRKRNLSPDEEKRLKAMLEADGYVWEEVVEDGDVRAAINARCFMEFEEYVNRLRMKSSFRLRRGIFK